jgi:alcohol dehydrogenase YqhD (iron-dependent ADH family)
MGKFISGAVNYPIKFCKSVLIKEKCFGTVLTLPATGSE